MNVLGCDRLRKISVAGTWYRAVRPQFVLEAFSTAYTRTITTRFSPATPVHPDFEILYLAQAEKATLHEVGALLGSLEKTGGEIVNTSACFAVVDVIVNLSDVADLTDPEEAALVATNAQELTGDWVCYTSERRSRYARSPSHTGVAPTQAFGKALFELRTFQGFLSFSAALPDYKILGVFPERLANSSSTLEYTYTDAAGESQRFQIP